MTADRVKICEVCGHIHNSVECPKCHEKKAELKEKPMGNIQHQDLYPDEWLIVH